jgi:hypothetical protein
VEANSTGGQGSRRAEAPSDDDDDDDIYTLYIYIYLTGEGKEEAIGRSCDTYEGEDKRVKNSDGEIWRKEPRWDDLFIFGGGGTLKWNSKKRDCRT